MLIKGILDTLHFISFGFVSEIKTFYNEFCHIGEKYNPKSFEGSSLKPFMMIIPAFFIAYLVIPILNGNYYTIFRYGGLLVGIDILLLTLISIIWHFGLKKYEGMN
jgi:ABC-type uncharacterized transport system permease subunit